MNKEFLKEIKEKLIKEKRNILNSTIENEIDSEGDETDQIQSKILLSLNNELSIRNKQKLLKINIALEKIDKDTYGICDDCQDEISEKRLKFNPHFDICISCAELREIENKRKFA